MPVKIQPLGSVPAAHEVRDLERKAAEKPNLAMAASSLQAFSHLLFCSSLLSANEDCAMAEAVGRQDTSCHENAH